MLTIPEVYDLFDQIGCCSFATLDGRGGVDSRIAHFFACDEEGLYLRTMDVKPFYRQLVEGGKLSVCGEKTAAPCSWDDDNMPHFQPGFMVRVSGDVRLLTREELDITQALMEGFTQAEIARELGISQQAVAARVKKIRAKLRSSFYGENGETRRR